VWANQCHNYLEAVAAFTGRETYSLLDLSSLGVVDTQDVPDFSTHAPELCFPLAEQLRVCDRSPCQARRSSRFERLYLSQWAWRRSSRSSTVEGTNCSRSFPHNGRRRGTQPQSSLNTLQPTQHLLPNTTLSNNHLNSLRNNTPAHSTPRSPPHASALILLPRSQNLGSTSSSSRASSRVNITRDASSRQTRGRIDRAHGDDFQAAGVCRGGGGLRGGNREDGFGYGELVAGWVEEDVGADGGYEEGDWRSGLVLGW
jgi:hypothetical protein